MNNYYSWPKRWLWLAILLVYVGFQTPALAKPMITVFGFAPTSQVVGGSITFIGSDLSGVTVTFSGGRVGVVTSVGNGSTTMTVTIPDSAQSGPITITRGTDTPVITSSITILNIAPTCTPSNGNGCSAVSIARVNISSTTFDQSSSCQGSNSGSYVSFPVGSTTSTTLTANTTFTLNARVGTGTGNVAAFIDWNRDGSFSSNEYYSLGTGVASGSTASLAISVPATGLIPGLTTMRIRAAATAIGSGNACTAYTTGETQDFFVTLAASQPAPLISSITPSGATIGSNVIVAGTNLQNGSFTINGVAMTAVINSGGTAATVTIPTGATTGRIAVTTPGGATVSSGNLTILSATDYVMGTAPATLTVCSGRFLSPGYPGNYANSLTLTQLITPSSANSQARLSFSSFATEARFDLMTIYNGPNATSPVLFTGLNGTLIPFTATASNGTGQLFVSFTSDNNGNAAGWDATISCVANTGPYVTTFTPSNGAIATSVTVTGGSFLGTGATTVSINGVPQNVTATTATSITFTVATGTSTGSLVISNSLGTVTTTTPFIVTPGAAPVVTSITPTSGNVGDSVVIIGTNLIGTTGNSVRFTSGFGFANATIRSNNGVRAVVIVPANAATGVITVTTNVGNTTTPTYTLLGAPTFTSFTTNAGGGGGGGGATVISSAAVGTTIRITGSNLAPGTPAVPGTVTFTGGVVATGVTTIGFGGGTLVVTIPAGALTGPVTIVTTGGSVTTSSFTILDGPSISSFTPNQTTAGSTVTFTGANLQASTFFFVNTAGGTTSVSPSSIATNGTSATVVVPADAATGTVQVSSANGSYNTSALGFNGTLTINQPLTITAFSPASGPVGTQLTLTCTGSNFTGTPSVTVGGVAATGVTSTRTGATTFTVVCTVASGTTTGPIIVTNSIGTGPASSTNFTVTTGSAAPTITSFTPTTGSAGTVVTVNGTGFVAGSLVLFNGVSATNVTIANSTRLTCTVPASATSGLITVSNSNGAGNTSTLTPARFTVTAAAPIITLLSPTSGNIGDAVIIVGSNFEAGSAVSFNGVAATSVVFLSSSTLQVAVPSGATSGLVTVTTTGGTSNGSSFSVTGGAAITYSPNFGIVGSTVTISGTGLSNSTVFFGSAQATVVSNSSTQVVVTVPSGAITGDLIISNALGSSILGTYTVIPTPTITSVSPSSASVGATISITGTNLTGISAVRFNGVDAGFLEINSTTLSVTVPATATTGFIQVDAAGGTVSSPGLFTVLTGRARISGFTPSLLSIGTQVAISGFFLNTVSQVYFNGTPATSYFVVDANNIIATAPGLASGGRIVIVSPLGNDTSLSSYTIGGGAICNSSTVTTDLGFLTPTASRQSVNVAANSTYLWKFYAEVGKTYNFSSCRSGNSSGTNDSYLRFYDRNNTLLSQLDDNGTTCGNNAGGTPTLLASADFTPLVSDTVKLLITRFSCATILFDQVLDYFERSSPAPGIYTFTPATTTTGSSVTIYGNNFVAGSTLTLNGLPITYSALTNNTITFLVPAAATSGLLTVTGSNGTATSFDNLNVVQVGSPVIAGFDPFSGRVNTVVTITGANLGSASITFAGTGGNAPITSQTASQVVVTVPAGSVTGPITATNSFGSFSTTTNFLITASGPTVTRFSPASAARGTTINVFGTSFSNATAVSFSGVTATYTVVNDTTISVTVPNTATSGQISVTNANGTGISANSFTVILPVPTITTFTPTSGNDGNTVTITGTNLLGASVFFGSIQATSTSANTATSITAVVPVGTTTGLITVNNQNGSSTSIIPFTILVPPTITSVSPNTGGAGMSVTISGTNLANSSVFFNGVSASVLDNTNISVTVTVPSGATTGFVSVTNSNGSATYPVPFTINPLFPVITGISPIVAARGTAVTIRGRNLSTASAYTFGGVALTRTSVNDSVLVLTFSSAATVAAVGPITVTTANGTTTTPDITYGNAGNTQFCGVIANDGGRIRVRESNQFAIGDLGGGAYWKFYAHADSIYNFNSCSNTQTGGGGGRTPDTYIRIYSLTDLTTEVAFNDDNGPTCGNGRSTLASIDFRPTATDTFIVLLTQYSTAGGGGGNGCSPLQQATQIDFSRRSALSTGPVISSFTNTVGYVNGGASILTAQVGETVRVSGTNLPTTVGAFFTINGITMVQTTAPAGFRAASATDQYVIVPVGATTGNIVVTVGTNVSTSAQQLTIITATSPTITSFTPGTGVTGTTVTVNGTNLTGCTFSINGVLQTITGTPTATRATITIAAGTTTGTILVTNTTSGAFSSSISSFIVTQPAPTITSFSPTSGLPGSSVTINGTGLLSPNAVTLNGVACSVTSSTSTSIVVVIPAGSTTGTFTVDQGTIGTATSAGNFTVLTSPVITAFTPSSGFVNDTVTISGSNLGSAAVRFNGILAVVTSNTSTSVRAIVPASATTGTITVTTSTGTATTASSFIVLAPASLTFNTPSGLSTTLCAGATGTVNVTVTGSASASNVYTVQGSNVSGSFASPTAIGTLTSSATGIVSIPVTIPTTASGAAYRYRVVASSPSSTSADNGVNITIGATPTTPTITAGNTSICPGQNLVLTASTGNAYLWSNGAISQSISVSAGGSYTVKTISAAGCTSASSSATVVTLGSTPATPTITASGPTTFCAGGSVSLNGPAGATSYLWSDGSTSRAINISASGSFTLQVTNANGCASAISNATLVTVNSAPAAPSVTATGSTTFCAGGSVTLTASSASSYLWSTGATSQSITANTSGSYSVQEISNGCTSASSAATIVTVNSTPATPVISATGSTTFCAGGTVTLNGPSGAASYIWSNGASTQNITVSNSGTYNLTVVQSGNCTSSVSNSISVTVNTVPSTPTVTASGATTFCTGGSVVLSATSSDGYLWSTGETTQSITVNNSGSYTVQAVANGCSSLSSSVINVTVNTIPTTPVISAGSSTTFCAGGTVTLNGPTSTGSYLWSNGATTQNITVNASGSYSLKTISIGCTSNTSNIVAVTVNAVPSTPTVTASGSTSFCAGGSVLLTASAGSAYIWSNGATTQSILVNTSGSYSVQTISTGCTSLASTATTVTVNPNPSTPTISASGSTSFCIGGSVTLNGPAGAASYIWSNGATTQNISATTSGTYSLAVTNASGCTSSVSNSIAVTVNTLPATPNITAGGSTSFCPGGSVVLTASSGNGYLWSNGATTASITVASAGSYTVQVINANGCTSAISAATSVVVNAVPSTPTIVAGGSTSFCIGGSVTLTAPASSSYIWSNGASTQSISANASGNYTVRVINANGCTSATSSAVSITVNPLPSTPTITASGSTTFCAGGSVTLTAPTSTGYVWSNGATTRTIIVNSTGSFTVQVTNASGCTSAVSAATAVTVNPVPSTPTITAGGSTTVCNGGSVTLTSSLGDGYIWSTGETTQSIAALSTGSYTVKVISSAGCTSLISTATSVVVSTTPATPSVTASGSTTICAGSSVSLTASSGASYLWSNGATTQTISVNSAGSYSVQITNAAGCQSAASSATSVIVNPAPSTPSITASGSTTFCSTDSIYLTASNGPRYLWSNGDTTASIKVKASGSYSVQARSAAGCLSAASVATSVTVNPAPAKPVVTASGPLAFCATGGSVVLSAPTATSYLWSTGETTQAITATSSIDITLNVSGSNGCVSPVSDVIRVRPITPTSVPITITTRGTSSAICSGDGVWIYGTPGLPAYTWSTGETTDSIFVRTAQTVSLAIGDGTCNNSLSNSLTVTVNPKPTTPVLTVADDTICTSSTAVINAPATSDGYLWSDGSTGTSLTVSASGTYFLRNRNATGCFSDTSNRISIVVLPVTATPTIVASGATTFCNGDSVILTAPLADYYLWNTNATTQSITVKSSGSYNVKVANNNSCTSDVSASVAVTANPVPVMPAITASGATTFCNGGSVTLSAPASATYLWSNGATTQSIDVATSGSFTVQVANATGCVSPMSSSSEVTVNPVPATPEINSNGLSSFCQGGSVVLSAPTADGYIWSNGETTQNITVNATGNYTVQVYTAQGCTSAVSAVEAITVNPLPATPTVSLSGSSTFCEGGSVTLTSSLAAAYLWNDGSITQSIVVNSAGSYSVQAISLEGCTSSASIAIPVTVNAVPATPAITAVGSTTFCAGGSVTLSTPDVAAGYVWSTGETTPSIVVSSTSNVTLQMINASGCSSAVSSAVSVSSNPVPATPVVTVNGSTTFCEGGSVTLTAPLAEGYIWSDGSTTRSISVTNSGDYSVALTTLAGCTSSTSTSVSVTVNSVPSTPSVSVTGSTTFCEGGSALLTAPTATAYIWSTGETTQSITAATTGSYSVQLLNASGCSSASSNIVSVTVNAIPSAATITAASATTICAGGTVTLDAPALPSGSYLWSNGATTASIAAAVTGDYSVQIISASGCTSSISNVIPVVINAVPAALSVSVTGGTTFCAGGSTTLTASSASGYLWSTGETSQSIVVTNSGSYTVQAQGAGGCNSESSTAVSITVNSAENAPIVTASGSTNLCTGGSVTLSASAITNGSYLWNTGETTQSISANTAGSYSVQAISSTGCTSLVSNVTSVTVGSTPVAPTVNVSGATTICAGNSVTLTSSQVLGNVWSTGETSQSISVNASGSYTVQNISATGCSSAISAPVVIIVNAAEPTPSITASGSTTICDGNSVTLSAATGSASYLWSNGETTSTISASASGSYTVQTISASGCTSAISNAIPVNVNTTPNAPIITAGGPTTVCVGGTVLLSVPAGGNYVWSDGSLGNSITAAISGSYSVREISVSGCTSLASTAVDVVVSSPIAQPVINANGSTSFCFGGSVILTAPASASYLWSSGETTQSINVTNSGSFSVVVANAAGCTSVSSNVIDVNVANNVAPLTITASGPLTFCGNGSVILTASTAPHYLWSTGDTTQLITVTGSGTYTVLGYNSIGCTSTVSNAVEVVAFAGVNTPTITTSNGTSQFCVGSSVVLSADAGFRYLWSNGDTTQSIVVSSPGQFTVQLISAEGCSSASSAPIAVTVSATPSTPTITASGSTTLCNGTSIVLTASSAAHYLWSTGDTTQTITVRFIGIYSVTLINESGCSSAASNPVSISVIAAPSSTTISRINGTDSLRAALTSPVPASYVWTYNGAILTGAVTRTIAIVGPGTYSVQTVSANGCRSIASNVINILDVDTKLPADLGHVYPNPFAGAFNLELNNLTEDKVMIHLTDITGREVFTQEVSLTNGATKATIEAQSLPNGMYNLLIDTSRGRLQSKLIKQ